RCVRITLEMKCAGLDAEAMARRSVEPSTMSLLGLVRHLAEMERHAFRTVMAGEDAPRLFCTDTDRDGDFDGAGPHPQVVAPPGGRAGGEGAPARGPARGRPAPPTPPPPSAAAAPPAPRHPPPGGCCGR